VAIRQALPQPIKRILRETARSAGTATSRARILPSFLIVGAQKCGTTALYTYLLQHPAFKGPASKEIEYFSRLYARGPSWYRGHFPLRGRARITGEATPDYLPHPHAPARAAQLLPDAKLIVLLRDPVDRALSAYAHQIAANREELSFAEAMAREDERIGNEFQRMQDDPDYYSFAWRYRSYAHRGLYAEQLERWFAAFPREQFLILGSEVDLFGDPAGTYARVLEFLGAEPYELDAYPPVLDRDYEPMDEELRQQLADRFREPNERLTALIGRDFGWNR
jgi:hypothetical protein